MKYLIIGAGVAGVSAVKEILSECKDEDEIVIITEESYPFYYRPRLIEYLSGKVDTADIIIHDEKWFEEREIDLKTNERAKKIDPENKTVTTTDNNYDYDKLLLANGAHSFVPSIEGKDKNKVFSLRDLKDAKDIRNAARNSDKGVVIGGGLLGLESAYNLSEAGLEVTVIEVFDHLMPRQLDQEGGEVLQNLLEKKGLEFLVGSNVTEFKGDKEVSSIEIEDEPNIDTDLVLMSAGIRCNTDLVENTDIEFNNGVIVDDFMESSVEDVYAAGDVAECQGNNYGLWTASKAEGRNAGINMANEDKEFPGFVPSHSLKVLGVNVVSAGEIDPEGDYESEIEKEEKSYKKIIKRNGEPVGVIIVGDKFMKDSNELVKKVKN